MHELCFQCILEVHLTSYSLIITISLLFEKIFLIYNSLPAVLTVYITIAQRRGAPKCIHICNAAYLVDYFHNTKEGLTYAPALHFQLTVHSKVV